MICLAGEQFRVSIGDIYRLDFSIYIEMAKGMNITIDALFFRKLSAYESTVIPIYRKRKKKKRNQ